MVKCEVVESTILSEDNISVKTYGLAFYRISKSGQLVKSVYDVFVDKNSINSLKELINENDLCEIHIDDIIEDALYS